MPAAPRRVLVDASGAWRPTVRDGVSRRRAAELYGTVADVHAGLSDAPVLPDPVDLDPILGLVHPLRARGGEGVGVVGQAGAVHAACVPALCLGSKVRRVTTPSAAQLDTARPWVALLGPAWVPEVVDHLLSLGAPVVVVGPPGEEPVDPPEGGWWLDDPQAGDGRGGGLGAGSLLVAALAGVDVERLVAGFASARETCSSNRYADHPAYTWATVAALSEADLARPVGIHLAADARLTPLARWAGRVWGATLVEDVQGAGLRSRLGGRAMDGVLGDEELWEMIATGPPDVHLVTWELQAPADPLAELGRRTLERTLRHASALGHPVLRIRLADLDPASLGHAMGLTIHAAAAAALLLDRDPRHLASLPALYAALDVDGGRGAE